MGENKNSNNEEKNSQLDRVSSPLDALEKGLPPSVVMGISSIARHIARPIRGCATNDQYMDVIERATCALTESVRARVWQPIETLPHDGTLRMFCMKGGGIYVAPSASPQPLTHEDRRALVRNGLDPWGKPDLVPTHWMPLPNPPEREAETTTVDNESSSQPFTLGFYFALADTGKRE